jgi:hypothetical protein
MRHKKNRRFVIFRVRFWRFLVQKSPIRIYRKTGPTKSTVLGPRPPPWEKHKIYRFLTFFIDFGVFNRAGKTVSKIGIYSKPPPKSEFYTIFNNLRPNFVPNTILFIRDSISTMGLIYRRPNFSRWTCPNLLWSLEIKKTVFLFSFFLRSAVFLVLFAFVSVAERIKKENRPSAPKKGPLQAQ